MEIIYLVGGNGFIGKNLVKNLALNYRIKVFDKSIDEEYFNSFSNVETCRINLEAEKILLEKGSPDYVINLVSVVTAQRDMSLFDKLVSSNIKVLLNLYDSFKEEKKLKLFIQFGSSEEYGGIKIPFKEEMRECPDSPYALIKQLTTNMAMMLYRNYKFPIMVVRPGNLFGPMQNGNKFIPYVIEHLKNDSSLEVSLCEQKRDFIYVDDFVLALKEILKNYQKCKGEIINISSGKSISLKEVIEICKSALNSKSQVYYGRLPYRENEIMDLKCDIKKFRKIIDKEIVFDVENKIKKML